MAEVVRQRLGFVLCLGESKPSRQCAGDLRDFERMRKPGAVVVALVENEDLGLVLETAERGRMDDTVAIAAKSAPRPALGLGMKPATAPLRIAGVRRMCRGSVHGIPGAPIDLEQTRT